MIETTGSLLGRDLRTILAAIIIVTSGLFIGLYLTFSVSQRQELTNLEDQIAELKKEGLDREERLQEFELTIEQQQRVIVDLEWRFFELRCDLAKGIIDYNQKTCTIGDLTQRFQLSQGPF